MRYLFFLLGWILLPASVHAAADLAISPQDIRFSRSQLVAGDEVRIYAKIYNVGDEDVSGYVSFYQGSSLIDDSLVISLPANGNADEVYVDFVVPDGSFNIWALVRGTDPADANPNNDSALTAAFIPVVDDDRDGIVNDEDNCPDASNSDQLDTDADGEGDGCDVDDDNDGLSDDVETELHSDPTLVDTDGDGINDAEDAFPDDADRGTAHSNRNRCCVRSVHFSSCGICLHPGHLEYLYVPCPHECPRSSGHDLGFWGWGFLVQAYRDACVHLFWGLPCDADHDR